MKTKINFYTGRLIIILLILNFSSCHFLFNKDDDDKPQHEYLVSHELEQTYLPDYIRMVFGQISNQFPEIEAISNRVKHGILIYKITYKTTFRDKPVIASGLACFPTGEGSFPILSFQNGTNTLHKNAPSANPNNELFLLLEAITSTGFVVVIPDYLGFGSSKDMFHPYLHKESTVQTVLDMLRAVKELAGEYNYPVKNELYITGYSQGGWATMQIQKAIEEKYMGEFNLKASSPGAGPYDLNFVKEHILKQNNYPMPYFFGYIYNSLINIYEDEVTSVGEIFNSPYDALIPKLFDGTKSGDEINSQLTTNTDLLFTENFRLNYKTGEMFEPLTQVFEENSIEAWNTSIPTLLVHGKADTYVPSDVTQFIYNGFTEKGAGNRVNLELIPGLDHTDAVVPAGLMAINWFLELTE